MGSVRMSLFSCSGDSSRYPGWEDITRGVTLAFLSIAPMASTSRILGQKSPKKHKYQTVVWRGDSVTTVRWLRDIYEGHREKLPFPRHCEVSKAQHTQTRRQEDANRSPRRSSHEWRPCGASGHGRRWGGGRRACTSIVAQLFVDGADTADWSGAT